MSNCAVLVNLTSSLVIIVLSIYIMKKSFGIITIIACFFSGSAVQAAEFCTLANAALQKNQGLLAIRHQLDASKERIIQTQNINGPKLDLLASLSAYTANQGSKTINKDGNIALSYSQTLYDHGLASAFEKQARSNDELLNLELAASGQQTIIEVANQYLQYQQSIQVLALHRKNVANTNEQFKNSEDKFAASQATQQELMLVKSRLRQAMSEMLRAKAQVILSRVKLLSLSNKNAKGNDGRFLRTLLNKMPYSKGSAIETAQRNSIEIEQTDVAIDIANSEVLAQEASLGPKVQVSARAGFGRIGINEGFAGQVGLDFSMPLYSSDVLQSKVREAKANLAAARAKRAYSMELAKQTVSANYEIAKNIRQSIAILPEAIRAEEAAIRSLEASLASSLIPVAEILLVKSSLFELKKGLINLKFERYFANLSLLNTVGHLKTMDTVRNIGLCG